MHYQYTEDYGAGSPLTYMERVSVNEDDFLMLCPTVPWDDHESGGQVCVVPHLLPRGTEAEGNCQHTKAGTHNIMGSKEGYLPLRSQTTVELYHCTSAVVDSNFNPLFSHFFLLDGILFCLLFEPMMGRGGSLSHGDGGMSTSLSPTSLRGQGMGFIV